MNMKSKEEVVSCLSAPLCICDSTLGSGEQAAGAVFSNIEKYRIAQLLDEAGVRQIEAGNPILGEEEKKAVRHVAHMGLDASVMAWNRADIGDINASLDCDVDSVTIALPSSSIQIENMLKKDKQWVLDKIYESTAYAAEHGLYISVVAEDASRADLGYLIDFAKEAKGTPSFLRESFRVEEIPLLLIDGEKVSSSRLREIISKEGDVELATSLLGHPYEMRGKVRKGLHNGTRIGFPTLNLLPDAPYVYPAAGVYEGVSYLSGLAYRSLINVGVNPTVGALKEPQVESHLLGYHGDAYGKTIYVSFSRRIRGEIKFASLDELKAQIEKDKASILAK